MNLENSIKIFDVGVKATPAVPEKHIINFFGLIICNKYEFDILIICGSYGGHKRHTTTMDNDTGMAQAPHR